MGKGGQCRTEKEDQARSGLERMVLVVLGNISSLHLPEGVRLRALDGMYDKSSSTIFFIALWN